MLMDQVACRKVKGFPHLKVRHKYKNIVHLPLDSLSIEIEYKELTLASKGNRQQEPGTL